MGYVYEPINIPEPPKHTQVSPRCFSCTKWEVCNLRSDYMKTAMLIQRILGDPQQDYELREEDGGFYGIPFPQPTLYFPETFVFEDETVATLLSAKYVNKNFVRVLYEINRYYYQFVFFWSEAEKYEITIGKELYYGLLIKMPKEVSDNIATNLLLWRSDMEEREAAEKEGELINTTFFSAILNCQFYEYDKKVDEKEKLHRMALQCDYPDDCCHHHHIATFHFENEKVPELSSKFSPIPVLYPVFIPKDKERKCKHKSSIRREDFNNGI